MPDSLWSWSPAADKPTKGLASRQVNGFSEPERPLEMKKGAGASPLLVIDAPKPVTESRFGAGHPGKPIS
jgi:hypothetical protein